MSKAKSSNLSEPTSIRVYTADEVKVKRILASPTAPSKALILRMAISKGLPHLEKKYGV